MCLSDPLCTAETIVQAHCVLIRNSSSAERLLSFRFSDLLLDRRKDFFLYVFFQRSRIPCDPCMIIIIPWNQVHVKMKDCLACRF